MKYWLIVILLYIFNRLADAAQLSHYHHQHRDLQHQQKVRQKLRMRTVFTESQSRQLEALFLRTDYPTAESRAELARTSGLSEETVRVSEKHQQLWTRFAIKFLYAVRIQTSSLRLTAALLCFRCGSRTAGLAGSGRAASQRSSRRRRLNAARTRSSTACCSCTPEGQRSADRLLKGPSDDFGVLPLLILDTLLLLFVLCSAVVLYWKALSNDAALLHSNLKPFMINRLIQRRWMVLFHFKINTFEDKLTLLTRCSRLMTALCCIDLWFLYYRYMVNCHLWPLMSIKLRFSPISQNLSLFILAAFTFCNLIYDEYFFCWK